MNAAAAAIASTAAPVITLEPIRNKTGSIERGRKAILVDGVRWGTIEPEYHGPRAVTYVFVQEGGHLIYDPDRTGLRGQLREYKVRGTSKRDLGLWEFGPVMPTEWKLLLAVKDLIRRDLLRHPDRVKTEQRERHARYLATVERENSERHARDLAKAHELIAQHAPGLNDRDPLAEAIAAAIEKARGEP